MLWPAALALWGPGDRTGRHAHHALHLLLCREGTLEAAWEEREARGAAGLLVDADVPHAIDARGREVLLLFVEPESEDGARLAASLRGAPARALSLRERDALLDGLATPWRADGVAAWAPRALETLTGHAAPAQRLHPRVRRVLRRLQGPSPLEDTSLESLAALAGLSPSRFMHVFTESVGVPLRPYLLWLRLQRAAGAAMAGAALGDAAHAAGFSDGAHFSRTFRRMFGMSPSRLRRGSQYVQARGAGASAH
ncbi:MAG TPA: AraC family transcriptional regulator [Aggregicoccus sp.]|nr:AraC family transcriptional regulator [Aggregicoccus sp.]